MQTPVLKQGPLNWLTEISLTCSESLSMKKLLENGPLSDFDLFEEYSYLAEIVRPILSDVLVETLQRFKKSDSTALVIRGLPVDDFIVSTPKTGYLPNWATPIAVRAQFAIYGLLDILPVVYYGENRTRLIRQVVPVKTSAKNASSHGSDVTFGYHVDNPDLPLSSEKFSSTASCPEYLS